MCGITGIFSLSGEPVEDIKNRIIKMTDLVHHRGPDNKDYYVNNDSTVALGHTRLSIVDPKCELKQPLQTKDNKSILSFNGEIYNYLDIRKDLESKGVVFRSNMDTEVLLEALLYYGEDALLSMDGMWSFAYYNTDSNQLLISRDLMGERQLFYRVEEGCLLFSSEIQPLIKDSKCNLEMDFEAILSSIQYSAAPPGKTLVKGIKRLNPGTNLIVDSKYGIKSYTYKKLQPEKWFDFFDSNPSLDNVVENYENLFYNVCKRRIPADVPYICTLSGGIDSTLVCLFASDFGKTKIQTLHGKSGQDTKSRNGEISECDTANQTAKILGTEHTIFDIDQEDSIPIIKNYSANAFDGEIDGVAFEILALQAKKMGYKVMLISDGPDELLGGYHCDYVSEKVDSFKKNSPLISSFYKKFNMLRGGKSLLRSFAKLDSNFINGLANNSSNPFWSSPVHYSSHLDNIVDPIFSKKVKNYYGTINSDYDHIVGKLDNSQKCALAYASNSLPNHFNLRTDRAFSHQSVEVRLPHQAPDMVEFLLAAPSRFRFTDNAQGKRILREVLRKHISPEIANRSKYGFAAPLWNNRKVYEALNVENTYNETTLFKDYPFKKDAKQTCFKNPKLLMRLYFILRTYENLKILNRNK